MSEDGGAPAPDLDAADAVVRERRGPSIVWLIPVLALVLAGAIAYRTISERGPEITLLLSEGGGLEAGKTKVKYLGMDVGQVVAVGIRDIKTIEATIEMNPGARPFMTAGTQWWVAKPRVGVGQISGLETIVSGSYVAVLPAVDDAGNPVGEPTSVFRALETPPLTAVYPNAVRIGLETDDLRGLGPGSGVRFRDIVVGEIERYELQKDGRGVRLWALIDDKYRDLVRPDSEFWNASGIALDVRPSGVRVEAESLQSMLVGGVDFETPPGSYGGAPIRNGTVFKLHRNRREASQALEQTGRGLVVWVESSSADPIDEHDAVFYRGVVVGRVGAPELSEDSTTVRFPLRISDRYRALVRTNSRFWAEKGMRFKAGWQGVEAQAGSIGTILAGGVAFATPTRPGDPAPIDRVYELHDVPEDGWLAWRPRIALKDVPKDERLPHVVSGAGSRSGLEIVLVSEQARGLSPGSPIYYRDFRVGELGRQQLSDDARHIETTAWIDRRYATLVRENTRFWNATGIGVDAGITGVKIRTQSLQAVMTGGVGFATPTRPGAEVAPRTRFRLHDELDEDWLDWSPPLALGGGVASAKK